MMVVVVVVVRVRRRRRVVVVLVLHVRRRRVVVVRVMTSEAGMTTWVVVAVAVMITIEGMMMRWVVTVQTLPVRALGAVAVIMMPVVVAVGVRCPMAVDTWAATWVITWAVAPVAVRRHGLVQPQSHHVSESRTLSVLSFLLVTKNTLPT